MRNDSLVVGTQPSQGILPWLRGLVFLLLVFSCGACAQGLPVSSGGSVGGVVQDRAGVPIPGAWIRFHVDREFKGEVRWCRADAEGQFLIEGIEASSVQLLFVPGDRSLRDEAGKTVEVAVPCADLVVVLEPGNDVALRIKGYVPSNLRPNLATLVWRGLDDIVGVRTVYVRRDGWVRFVQLPDDTEFEAWGYVSDGYEFRAPGIRLSDTEQLVQASKTRDISGRIIVPDGEAIEHVSVLLEPFPGVVRRHANPRDDGTFLLEGVPLGGRYVLSASFTGGRRGRPVSVTVHAGDHDVVLRPE